MSYNRAPFLPSAYSLTGTAHSLRASRPPEEKTQSSFRLRGRNDNIMNFARRRADTEALLRQTHLARKRLVRFPRRRMPRVRFLHHLIDLLEAEPLSLGDEEVGEEGGEDAEGAPEEEDASAEVGVVFFGADEVGGDCCDDLFFMRRSVNFAPCGSLLDSVPFFFIGGVLLGRIFLQTSSAKG